MMYYSQDAAIVTLVVPVLPGGSSGVEQGGVAGTPPKARRQTSKPQEHAPKSTKYTNLVPLTAPLHDITHLLIMHT